jgi:hypothetical protein
MAIPEIKTSSLDDQGKIKKTAKIFLFNILAVCYFRNNCSLSQRQLARPHIA